MYIIADELAVKYDTHRNLLRNNKTAVRIPWGDFKQEGWGTELNVQAVVENITNIKFQAQSTSFEGEGTLKIKSVGLYK